MIDIHPDFMELADWLGPEFRLDWCDSGDDKSHNDAAKYPDYNTFVRNTNVFCYQNIGLLAQGITRPYIARLLEYTTDFTSPTLLEVGAGGGQLGLALHTLGYKVSFADIYSRSWLFLRWRLHQRGLNLPLYIWDDPDTAIPLHDVAVCFDVLEHLQSGERYALIERLAQVGKVVFANLIRESDELAGIHFPLDFDEVTAYIGARWSCLWRDYYPDAQGRARQRLVIYGTGLAVHERNRHESDHDVRGSV